MHNSSCQYKFMAKILNSITNLSIFRFPLDYRLILLFTSYENAGGWVEKRSILFFHASKWILIEFKLFCIDALFSMFVYKVFNQNIFDGIE